MLFLILKLSLSFPFYSCFCQITIFYFVAEINSKGMEINLEKVADLIAANVINTLKKVLTVDEAARYMGISKSTLYKMMMRREIPYSKPNGKVCFFDRVELEAWLMSNRMATADEISDQAQAYCARTRTKIKMKGGAK